MLIKNTSIILFFLTAYSHCFSQPSDNVKSLSLGRTSVANTYNLDAFNHNPANLRESGSKDSSKIYFNAFSTIGYVLNSDFLSINFYNKFFTGDANGNKRFLTDADKNEMLQASKNTDIGFNLNYKILSFLINTKKAGSFGFALEDKISAKSYISPDLASLLLFGNSVERAYNVSDFNLNMSWIRQLNFSYANSTDKFFGKELSFGISVKPQLGYYYLGVKKNDLNLYTNDSNKLTGTGSLEFLTSDITDNGKVVYPLFGDISGFGLGFDLGLNLKLNERFNVGLSIVDLGYIHWTKNVRKYIYSGQFEINDLSTQDQLDTLRQLINGTKSIDDPFTNNLPTTVRIGLTYKFFRNITQAGSEGEVARVSFDYIQGIKKDIAGNTTIPIIALGGEFAVTSFLHPRLGMVVGGDEKYTLSAGLGFVTKYVLIDLGTHNVLTLFNIKNSSRISGGVNIKFRF
ncbi:hypothetical protein BH10BAC5_BH10BAC5_01190 [soil metagenome]